jgi:hypothetical protein
MEGFSSSALSLLLRAPGRGRGQCSLVVNRR